METKIVIDVNHLFVPEWEKTVSDLFGEEEQAAKIVPAAAIRRVREIVLEIREKGEWSEDSHTDVYVALDSPPYDRKKILPEYKSNRPARSEHFKKAREAFEQTLAFEQGFIIQASPGAEADDVIATLVASEEDVRWIIATRDKDLFQLVARNVMVFSTQAKTFFGPEEVKKKVGVYPEEVNAYLSLVGDASDCVPGVTGIGPKNAVEIVTAFGPSVEDIIAHAKDSSSSMKEKHREQILGAEQVLMLASTVIELQMVELGMAVSIQEGPGSHADDAAAYQLSSRLDGTKANTAGISVAEQRKREPSLVAISKHQMPVFAEKAKRSMKIMSVEEVQTLGALANQLFKSGLYARFRSAEGMFAVMATGMELGFAPISSLGYFHLVEGKVTMGAHMLIALARRSPECEFFECVEETATSATYEVAKANGLKAKFTYTIEDAKRDQATWVGRGKNIRAMIRKTAGSQAARLWFPAETNGLYSAEEMGEEVEE